MFIPLPTPLKAYYSVRKQPIPNVPVVGLYLIIGRKKRTHSTKYTYHPDMLSTFREVGLEYRLHQSMKRKRVTFCVSLYQR